MCWPRDSGAGQGVVGGLIPLISTLITSIDFRVYSLHPGLDTPDSRTDATQRLDSPSIARRRGRARDHVNGGLSWRARLCTLRTHLSTSEAPYRSHPCRHPRVSRTTVGVFRIRLARGDHPSWRGDRLLPAGAAASSSDGRAGLTPCRRPARAAHRRQRCERRRPRRRIYRPQKTGPTSNRLTGGCWMRIACITLKER